MEDLNMDFTMETKVKEIIMAGNELNKIAVLEIHRNSIGIYFVICLFFQASVLNSILEPPKPNTK